MTRAVISLWRKSDRQAAARLIERVPDGTRVSFKGAKRTLPQNDRMWAMLTDVSRQKDHCGRTYTANQWKVLFLHACGREVQFIPALDGSTFIPWGQSSSDLSKDEMSALIDFIAAWGAQNGVVFNDGKEDAA